LEPATSLFGVYQIVTNNYVPALFEWETACLLLSFPSTYKFNTYINQLNRITEDTVIPNT